MAPAQYAQRVHRLARVFGLLLNHPEGLSMEQLADASGLSVRELRSDFEVFMNRDVPVSTDIALTQGIGLEFVSEQGEETVSTDAERVRLTSDAPLTELGLEYFSADVIGPLYRAARDLSATEPDNTVLAQAVQRLETTLMTGIDGRAPYGGPVAAALRDAAARHRRVRIDYWRAWRPGRTTRLIDPYRVVSTRRGFEVDAGPLDDQGAIRTFLVSGIRSLEVTDEPFDRPGDVDARIAASRTITEVRVVVPRDLLWVVGRFAETMRVLQADDDLEVAAFVLPPVADRVGLMMTIAGPQAFVVTPESLTGAGVASARRLLEHHGLDSPDT
jgi:predicted DNA-binding transcriptional regulator YafY